MSHLAELEGRSLYIIREAYERLGDGRMAALWSMGKDSTTLLWLVRKAFMGRIPFPVIHIDTSYKMPEMYRFRERMAAELSLDLRVVRNESALKAGMNPGKSDRLACCTALKTHMLQQAVSDLGLQGLLLAIRRDEHGVRAKERYISPRGSDGNWRYQDQPLELWGQVPAAPEGHGAHHRIHPMLDWSELDVWEYIAAENIPVNELYFAKDGKRYRSLGCAPCTTPVNSEAANIFEIVSELEATQVPERAGRAQDKEHEETMQKLRALGYM